MIRKALVIFVILAMAVVCGAETIIKKLEGIAKPSHVIVDDTQMYVTELTSIYIYSLKDFKLVKKFGKKGEGPQEFFLTPITAALFINVHTEDIVVNSSAKISWFTKAGKFKKEVRVPSPYILEIQPFGDNIVGVAIAEKDKKLWRVLNIFSPQFKRLHRVQLQPHHFQQGKGMRVFQTNPFNIIYDNKLFIAWEKELVIRVVDTENKELYTIKHDYKKLKVTEEDKKDVIHVLKTDPETKEMFHMLQPIMFPDYYPAIRNMFVTGDKIYVMTFKREDKGKKSEFLILDIKGKLLKRVMFPLKSEGPMGVYPHTIYKGVVYQLVEDTKEEDWSLHMTEIK